MIVFGGVNEATRNEVWELSLPDVGPPMWRQFPAAVGEAPSVFGGLGAEVDAQGDRVVVFGRRFDSEVWALALPASGAPTWTRIAGVTPGATPGVGGPTLNTVYDAAGRRVIRARGVDQLEVWALPLAASGTPAWTALSGPPGLGARAGPSAVYDETGQRMIVFGGRGMFICAPARPGEVSPCPPEAPTVGLLNDAQALSLSGASPEWTRLSPSGTPPAARQDHSAVYDAANRRMIVYGGSTSDYSYGVGLNDVWALSLPEAGAPAWTQLSPSGTAPPRMRHTAILDAANARMIVFGGVTSGGQPLGDTWELTLPASGSPVWKQIPVEGPLARSGHVAVYDGERRRMIVYGGSGGTLAPVYVDVWALSLANPAAPAWSRLDVVGAGPGLRQSLAAVYDSALQRMIVFGPETPLPLPGPYPTEPFTTTWALPLSVPGSLQWTALRASPPSPVPPPVGRHSAVYDSSGRRTVLLGSQPGVTVWTLPSAACP
jgi:hypothetical protein